ncbi:MAG: mannonate dehydratase [Chitinophagaceae bacterium]|nr:MAG: mannonate dehydratase [Chitinophagaceae bacterium]
MKRAIFFPAIIFFSLLNASAQTSSMPQLVKRGHYTQLLVNGKPYLIFGGELGNSSASSNAYMRPIWPKLKEMNLNTVIAPVYWELMEPAEGEFDFSLVDSLIENARLNNMKLVLLWFGSWKNSMSCYAPAWVKTNIERCPRVLTKDGVSEEILTPFNKNNLEADKKAFVKLMQHIKQVDDKQNTVIAIQVENEIGMLGSARSYDEAANAAFDKPVPGQLINYLQKNKDSLTPEIDSIWKENGFRTSGNWENIFGKNLETEEIFTAWNYARYVNEITTAGKSVYDLPMYVNTALNRPGWKPGQYPSGGPLPHLRDIWKAGAPEIDMLAPDIYFPDFQHWCDLYTRFSDPLFIPEIRFEKEDAAKAFFAFGHYNCLSFSPFSIESTEHPEEEPIAKAYHILRQISPLITKYQPEGKVSGFLLSKDSLSQSITVGDYQLTVKHDFTLPWSSGSREGEWPLTGCTIIAVASNEFYVAGTGVVVSFKSTIHGKRAGILSVDDGSFEDGKWIAGRRMNGDQDNQGRYVRIPINDYDIQRVKLYQY